MFESLICRIQLISAALAGTILSVDAGKRDGEFKISLIYLESVPWQCIDAQAQLNKLEADLATANKSQQGLSNMQTQFAGLAAQLTVICSSLNTFASMWTGVR
jgi:hypothetical protein